MTGSLSPHEEVKVGGPLDEARLRQIMVRGWLFRNLAVSEKEAFEFKNPHDPAPGERMPWSDHEHLGQHTDGETPTLVWDHGPKLNADTTDYAAASVEVHMGCGEVCGTFAAVPYNGDMGGVPSENAVAIAHAGRDLIDLVREVRLLRSTFQVEPSRDTVLVMNVPNGAALEQVRAAAEGVSKDLGCGVLAMTFPVMALPLHDVEAGIELLKQTMTRTCAANELRELLEPVLGMVDAVAASRAMWANTEVVTASAVLRKLLNIADESPTDTAN